MPNFFDKDEIKNVYSSAVSDAREWRKDYPEYERLADNGLLEDLDESEPEVNDGSLSAALFKLPKRIVNSKLKGRAVALDADDAWVTELANLRWEKVIIPNANSQAPFHRKWKDAVRKSAIYGSQPVINLFIENGSYTGSDFVVPQAQDVRLEPGKVSDTDSDIIFWDVYYSIKQVKDLLEEAKQDKSGLNKWDTKALQDIITGKMEEDREATDDNSAKDGKGVKKGGVKFVVVYQRGVEAPFCLWHQATNKFVKEWTNPDPTGDLPVHFLYCYQDFVNPYGIGIVKLAGGTQNVLDYMRRADVLATQLGIRPPKLIEGDADDVDEDSMVYAQDANWYVGRAKVTRMELANGVYNALPDRIQMYQSSLNKLMPMGDTSVSAGSGDPLQSKTPAGVKLQAANLSIDDDDFKDNLYMTYELVAKSMINTDFANLEGTDLMKLNDEEREIMTKAGLEFPVDDQGNPTNELQVIWDEARATFDFELEPEQDKAKDDEKRLEGLLKVTELRAADPMLDQKLQMNGMKINDGELYSEIIGLTTDNDKIIEEISPEEQEMGVDPMTGQPLQQEQMQQQTTEALNPETQAMPEPMPEVAPEMPVEAPRDPEVAQLMQMYGVDQPTAEGMFAALEAGFTAEQVMEHVSSLNAQ